MGPPVVASKEAVAEGHGGFDKGDTGGEPNLFVAVAGYCAKTDEHEAKAARLPECEASWSGMLRPAIFDVRLEWEEAGEFSCLWANTGSFVSCRCCPMR